MLYNLLKLIINNILFYFDFINQEKLDDSLFHFIKDSGIIFIKYAQMITSVNKQHPEISSYLFLKLKTLQDHNHINDIFLFNNIDYIDKYPINSGSVAHIYKINYNNKICVLKSLIPNVEYKLNKNINDFKKYKFLIYFLNKNFYNIFNSLDHDDYYTILKNNIDLIKETSNIKLFENIFNSHNRFIIPEIYTHDNEKIIMSYEEGLKIEEVEEKHPELYEEALLLLLSFIYVSIDNQVFHCDLHFSNFLFRIENNKIKLIILDFGMIKKLNETEKNIYLEIFDCTTKDEYQQQINIILNYYSNTEYNINDIKDLIKIIYQDNTDNILLKLYSSLQLLNLLKYIIEKNDIILNKFYYFLSKNNFICI